MHKTMRTLGCPLSVLGIGLILGPHIPMLVLDAQAESFNVKPGAWETTTTAITSGSKLSPEQSTRLTPQQRAKMEKMLKARDGKSMTLTDQSCLTKEDISQDRIVKEIEDEDADTEVRCKIKVISKSSTKLVVDQMCPAPPSSTTRLTIEAKTPESFVATGDRDLSGSGKTHLEIKGTWLGTSCAGIEE